MSLLEWQSHLSQALVLPDRPESESLQALSEVECSKLALYEELIFNTVRDTLQNIYPFTYALLSRNGDDKAAWETLVEHYRRERPNRSYKLMGAVSGFHQYLPIQRELLEKFPFLPDLALYEWLEMEVMNLPDSPPLLGLLSQIPEIEDFSAFCPVWNSAKRLQAFNYNIPALLDELKQTKEPQALESFPPGPVNILVYRDPETLDARFFCLNDLSASLIRLSEDGSSYGQSLSALKLALPALKDLPLDVIRPQAAQLFQNCFQRGMLLGSIPV